ncbi:branched-chain amino acid transport system II carrier protein [Shewanella khirikhana]|uniref:Branched-chain amino acid transport system carrier protein n=1 Tax=Shewanella khirikhana TaxID=1965282 RepID=A0ABM8HK35_9GAMM|nr:branched-chain amino acid transport system II carrier protein [Shewanella khirikhana]AZQ13238.1 Branched-chain amino acid transport system 2 carrier protein [Shewanella khirikhana]
MKFRDIAALGFLTFAMYLGAGNLIFPPFLGYQAGDAFWPAMAGFLLTGVGLPAFALVMVALCRGSENLTAHLPNWFAKSFWVLLFIVIGPAFVIPRAITVAYEFTLAPAGDDALLLPFTLGFCLLSAWFCFHPGRLIDRVGKLLTPMLLILLGVLAALALGQTPEIGVATGAYATRPFAEGLTQGYMTMDALGSIGFGWVIFAAIRGFGVNCPKLTSRYTLLAALMYGFAMALVYLALAWLGRGAVGEFANGGAILTSFTSAHLGTAGSLILALVMLLACLTTVIGVTSAGSEFYEKSFRQVRYRQAVGVSLLVSALVANLGLDTLLTITLPVVVALHPLAIALLLIAPLRRRLSRLAQGLVLATASGFGLIDAGHILGLFGDKALKLLAHLPLFDSFASWLLPTLAMLGLSVLIARLRANRQKTKAVAAA